MRLILASNSPRRKELLLNAGFDFEVRASDVEEVRREGESAEDFVCRLARDKAAAVASSAPAGTPVLGADTVVVIGDRILGKPAGPDDAVKMLRLLAGGTHRVITGVCLMRAPQQIAASEYDITRVTFSDLSEDEIQEYVRSREPLDKAGAYGIQGLASKFITRIEGSYFNVMGLPVHLVYDILKPFLIVEQ